MQMTCALS